MVGIIDPALPDLAWAVIRAALPDRSPRLRDTDCLFFAAAGHAALGSAGWRFAAGGAFTPECDVRGWGLVVDPRSPQFYLTADREVDPNDGGYCGHCWVQCGVAWPVVVDCHTGYIGPRHDYQRPVVYQEIPSLTRSIRRHHAEKLKAMVKAARKSAELRSAMATAAQTAFEISA